MMTPVSDNSHKPEILFLVIPDVGLVCVTISEPFNLTGGVLICLIRVIFKF